MVWLSKNLSSEMEYFMFIQLQAIYGPVHMFKIYHLVEELLWPVPSAVPSHILNYYGQLKCPTISHIELLWPAQVPYHLT